MPEGSMVALLFAKAGGTTMTVGVLGAGAAAAKNQARNADGAASEIHIQGLSPNERTRRMTLQGHPPTPRGDVGGFPRTQRNLLDDRRDLDHAGVEALRQETAFAQVHGLAQRRARRLALG